MYKKQKNMKMLWIMRFVTLCESDSEYQFEKSEDMPN